MIKMVVSDMDGTLLNSNLEISQENLQAIAKLRAQGIRFCVATGRPEQLLKEYVEQLQMEDPMIMYNGSVIGHPFQEQKLYELKLEKTDIRSIIEYCEENDIIYMAYTKDKLISKPNYRVDFFEKRNELLLEKNKCVFKDIRNIETIVNENNINKILLMKLNTSKSKKCYYNIRSTKLLQVKKGLSILILKELQKGMPLKYLQITLDIKWMKL